MKILWRLVAWAGGLVRRLYWRATYDGLRSRYSLDASFRFNGFGILFYGDGSISAGSRSYIGELSTVQAAAGQAVRIGRDCLISHNVRIYTESAVADSDFRTGEVTSSRGDVVIGDGVWIGANVYIGPGVTIGDDAVIGANSVVTRAVPAGEIWGGVPARLLRRKRR